MQTGPEKAVSFLPSSSLRAIANNNLQHYIEKNGGANQNFHYGTKITDHVMLGIHIENRHKYNYFLMAGKDDNVILNNIPDKSIYLEGFTSVHSDVAEYEKPAPILTIG